MNRMNENAATLHLRDFMDDQDGWGHEQGRRVHDALLRRIESLPEAQVIRVSLAGVRRTDASFPRESVVELACRYRGVRGICLVDTTDADLLDNWDAAASKRRQALLSWNGRRWRLLGPQPLKGNRAVFELVMRNGTTTASTAAKKLGLSLTNVSTKLKQLVESGYILRNEGTSASGGVEYVYFRIK